MANGDDSTAGIVVAHFIGSGSWWLSYGESRGGFQVTPVYTRDGPANEEVDAVALGVGMFYYCEALSEQRAARCIVATGAPLGRGLPRDAEPLHPRACMAVPSPCASCRTCCQGQITQRCMPDLGQKDSNAIRCEDQEVRRSNTELTDEGPQGGPIH
jgi:hypothetical protein